MRSMKLAGAALALLTLVSCKTVGVSRVDTGYATVSPAVAWDMMLDTRELIVLDFRSDAQFYGDEGHIGGAISVPFDRIETKLPELMPYASTTVLVYGEDHEASARGARVLVAAGFRNIVVIDGGLRRWIERGFRTVSAE